MIRILLNFNSHFAEFSFERIKIEISHLITERFIFFHRIRTDASGSLPKKRCFEKPFSR